MGANSYEPREAISPCGQGEERYEGVPFPFPQESAVYASRGDAKGAQAGLEKGSFSMTTAADPSSRSLVPSIRSEPPEHGRRLMLIYEVGICTRS